MGYSVITMVGFYLYLLVLAMIGTKVNDRKRIYILFFQVLSVSVFYGFRNESIGIDTPTYIKIYLNQQNWTEFGFYIINQIIYTLTKGNWQIYLFIICFITAFNMALFYKIIFKNNLKYINLAYWSLYIMPYTILMTINIVRQGLALSFLLLGLSLFGINKKKIGILLVIVSCSIHTSMVVLTIGLVLAWFLKPNYIISICLIITSLFISELGVIKSLVMYLPEGYIKSRYLGYFERETEISLLIKYIFYFCNYIFMILLASKNKDRTYNFLEKVVNVIMLTSAITYSSEVTSTRMILSMDYIIPLIFLYPMSTFKEQKIYLVIYLLLIILYFSYIIMSQSIRINLNY